ncbi:unnamed protein product, partial [Laminaria digitata]
SSISPGGSKNSSSKNTSSKNSRGKGSGRINAGSSSNNAGSKAAEKSIVEKIRRSRRGGATATGNFLAALAEAQRTTLLQLSGVSVTSVVARAGLEEARESNRRAAVKREKANGRGGGGGSGDGGDGGSARAGRG